MQKLFITIMTMLLIASCGSATTTNPTSSTGTEVATSSTTTPPTQTGSQGGNNPLKEVKANDAELQKMIAEVEPKFQTFEYTDANTGKN